MFKNLSRNLSKTQLPYNRLDFFNKFEAATIQPSRVKFPEHMNQTYGNTLDNYDILPVTTKKSLLNCVLKSVLDQDTYQNLDWNTKVKYIATLRDDMHRKLEVHRDSNKNLKKLKLSAIKAGLEDELSTEALYYLSVYLNLNLVVIDNRELNHYFPDKKHLAYKATLILYLSDDGIYYLVSYNTDTYIHTHSESPLLKELSEGESEIVCNIAMEVKDPMEQKVKELMKHKLAELQDICIERGLVIKKNNGEKLVNCKKEELAFKIAYDIV